jgi:hypothetical protein
MLVFVQRERNNIVFTRQSNWRPLCTEMEGSILVKYAGQVPEVKLFYHIIAI